MNWDRVGSAARDQGLSERASPEISGRLRLLTALWSKFGNARLKEAAIGDTSSTALADVPFVRSPELRLWDRRFKSLFVSKAQAHPELLQIPVSVIDSFADVLRTAQLKRNAARYVLACISAIAFFATVPLTIGTLVRASYPYRTQIDQILSNRQFWQAHPEASLATGLAMCAVIVYVTVPFISFRNHNPLGWIGTVFYHDKSHTSIRAFAFISAYSMVLPLLIVFGLKTPHSASVTFFVLAAWLFLPVGIASGIGVALVLSFVFVDRIERIEYSASLARLSLNLLSILDRLDKVSDMAMLTLESRSNLIRSIVGASRRMKALHDYGDDPASTWAKSQMDRAARNFLRLAVWVYFPQEGTLAALKNELLRYIRIALSGRLHELPREDDADAADLRFESPAPNGWRRIAAHFGTATYLIVPVLGYATALQLAHLQISRQLQTVLGLLYLLWALAGLLIFSDRIAPESRELLVDTLKAVVGRK